MRLTYRCMCNSIGKKWNQALTLIKILTHTHTNKLQLEEKYSYNLSENTLRFFYLSTWFPFSTSEAELPYYHHKVNVQVAEQDAKRLKDSLKMRDFKKSFCSSSRTLNKINYQIFHKSLTLLDFINLS